MFSLFSHAQRDVFRKSLSPRLPAIACGSHQKSSWFLLHQFFHFASQQALSCLFPFLLVLTFAVTQRWTPTGLHRYDLILLVCLAVQFGMYYTRMETKDELKVIGVFHLAGLGLELFKTHWHCWSYPEPGWTKLAGVPIYSGFMYASVASYLCQAWRRFGLQLFGWPRSRMPKLLAGAIYLNFFTEHWLPDARWLLTALVLLAFGRTTVGFRVRGFSYAMPLPVAFVLMGLFLWAAENVSTFFGAWQYPNQQGGWHLVPIAKMSSWSLLIIFSFLIVAQLKRVKQKMTNQSS